MTTTTISITGMTCSHCVAAVTEELRAVPGVADVAVDLESGSATVTSETELAPDVLRAAVEEAGYEVAT